MKEERMKDERGRALAFWGEKLKTHSNNCGCSWYSPAVEFMGGHLIDGVLHGNFMWYSHPAASMGDRLETRAELPFSVFFPRE